MNPFISVPLGCRALDLVERLVHGSGGRQETGSSSEDMLCWANSNGYAALEGQPASERDHPAPVLGTFRFVEFRFPVGDFLC
jgi:hypothetical protein